MKENIKCPDCFEPCFGKACKCDKENFAPISHKISSKMVQNTKLICSLADKWRSEGEYWSGIPEHRARQECADDLLLAFGLTDNERLKLADRKLISHIPEHHRYPEDDVPAGVVQELIKAINADDKIKSQFLCPCSLHKRLKNAFNAVVKVLETNSQVKDDGS